MAIYHDEAGWICFISVGSGAAPPQSAVPYPLISHHGMSVDHGYFEYPLPPAAWQPKYVLLYDLQYPTR
eukprot:768814-Hanusia_phi.AAC.2